MGRSCCCGKGQRRGEQMTMKRSGMFVVLHRLVGRVRFWFFETFGERDIERTHPAHGDWTETCGWNFRGRFYPCDKTPNATLSGNGNLEGDQ